MWHILYPFTHGPIDGIRGMHIATAGSDDGRRRTRGASEGTSGKHLIGKMVETC